jgi:hypothetical protein
VESVVDKVSLVHILLQVLQFSLINIIPLWLSILMYHMGDEQEVRWWLQITRQSHPIDTNNNSLLVVYVTCHDKSLNLDSNETVMKRSFSQVL